MSGFQKALKVIAIILIVFGILGIVFSAVTLLTGIGAWNIGVSQSAAGMLAFSGLSLGLGILGLLGGIIELLVGLLGLRGADDPTRVGPFYVLAILNLVIEAVSLITALASVGGGSDPTSLTNPVVSTVVAVIVVWVAAKVRAQALRSLGD